MPVPGSTFPRSPLAELDGDVQSFAVDTEGGREWRT